MIKEKSTDIDDIFIGGLVGNAYSTTIKNSSFKGAFAIENGTFKRNHVGGILGRALNSSIERSFSNGNITIYNGEKVILGGIVGYTEILSDGWPLQSKISKCFNLCNLSAGKSSSSIVAEAYVGGIVGEAKSSKCGYIQLFNLNINTRRQT